MISRSEYFHLSGAIRQQQWSLLVPWVPRRVIMGVDVNLGAFFGYRLNSFSGAIDGITHNHVDFAYKYRENVGDYDNTDVSDARWATATLASPQAASAPGPLPILGAGAAFGFSRQLRKRIKLAPAAMGSSLPRA